MKMNFGQLVRFTILSALGFCMKYLYKKNRKKASMDVFQIRKYQINGIMCNT